jgi:carbamoylphosphate synthase small subunit
MKYQYFISSRWRNRDAVLELTRKLREKGKTVYCFFEASHAKHRIDHNPNVDMEEFEKRDWRKDAYVKEVFENDLQAENESENFVLLLPAGKSAHIEAGIAYGMGKKCILIGQQKEAESLYRIFTESHNTIDDFITSLAKD